MFLKNSVSAVESAGQRSPGWWTVPAVATVLVLIVDVTCWVTVSVQNSHHGAGPEGGFAFIGAVFFALISLFPLCAAWFAAAFPSAKAARGGQVPVAVIVFLFLAFVFQLFTVWIVVQLATHNIGGK